MWHRLTSRKFLAAVGAAVATTICAANGACTWAEAVNAWALVAAGYAIGEGIADSSGTWSESSEQLVDSGDSGES